MQEIRKWIVVDHTRFGLWMRNWTQFWSHGMNNKERITFDIRCGTRQQIGRVGGRRWSAVTGTGTGTGGGGAAAVATNSNTCAGGVLNIEGVMWTDWQRGQT